MKILRRISQLATCPPDRAQGDIDTVDQAALVIDDGHIAWLGRDADLPAEYAQDGAVNAELIDCRGQLVIPGLVDCHTHLAFGGWRGDEFAQRLAGASYQDIQAAGGGIHATVRATRKAQTDTLFHRAEHVTREMLKLGVTAVEAKTGYGLSEAEEWKLLQVYRRLDRAVPVTIVPTLLAAHVVPEEFAGRRDDYVELICQVLIPRAADEGMAKFCDIFVEEGAYTVAEGRRIGQAALDHGLGVKIHADQLSASGGGRLAAELGAVSAEHLEHADSATRAALAESGTVAVSLPLASTYLNQPFLSAREFLDAGVQVAVATDFNPGTAPSWHLPLAMMLACTGQRMTPAQALAGATCVAARACGLTDSAGTLAVGRRADLAIIEAPDVNHWLYHFRPNACLATYIDGDAVWP